MRYRRGTLTDCGRCGNCAYHRAHRHSPSFRPHHATLPMILRPLRRLGALGLAALVVADERLAACRRKKPRRRRGDAERHAEPRQGAARQPDRHHLQVRRRQRRAVHRRLPRHRARRRRRRRADVRPFDHNPPTPTTQWKPGQTVEYTRTVSSRSIRTSARPRSRSACYSTDDAEARCRSPARTSGQHAYKVAKLQLQPQTENVFTVFKDGWHPAEVAEHNATSSGSGRRRTRRSRSRTRRRTAIFYLDVDNPGSVFNEPQQVKVSARRPGRGRVHAEAESSRSCGRFRSRRRSSGTDDMAELHDLGRQDLRAGGRDVEQQGSARARRSCVPRVRRPAVRYAELQHDDAEDQARSAVSRSLPFVALCPCVATPARRAQSSCFSTSGRTLSVKSHRVEGDSLVLALRGGGEIVCESAHRRAFRAGRGAVSGAGSRTAGRRSLPWSRRLTSRTARSSTRCRREQDVSRQAGAGGDPGRVGLPASAPDRRKGAMGLMQLMPATARQYARRRPVRSAVEHRGGHQAPEDAAAAPAGRAGAGGVQRGRSGGAAIQRHSAVSLRPAATSPASSASRTVSKNAQFRPAFRAPRDGLTVQRGSDSKVRYNYNVRLNCGIPLPARVAQRGNRRRRVCRRHRSPSAPRARRERALRPLAAAEARRSPASRFSCRSGRTINTREFLVFNQELATLLKAGMPLVQSLDLLRAARHVAGVPPRARRRPREGAVGHGAVGRLRRARRPVPARLHARRCSPASAAATSTRCCAATSSTRRSSRR